MKNYKAYLFILVFIIILGVIVSISELIIDIWAVIILIGFTGLFTGLAVTIFYLWKNLSINENIKELTSVIFIFSIGSLFSCFLFFLSLLPFPVLLKNFFELFFFISIILLLYLFLSLFLGLILVIYFLIKRKEEGFIFKRKLVLSFLVAIFFLSAIFIFFFLLSRPGPPPRTPATISKLSSVRPGISMCCGDRESSLISANNPTINTSMCSNDSAYYFPIAEELYVDSVEYILINNCDEYDPKYKIILSGHPNSYCNGVWIVSEVSVEPPEGCR